MFMIRGGGIWRYHGVWRWIKPFIYKNESSRCFKNLITTLPTMRDVVRGNCCSVTLLSILKASPFVMVVLRFMWRRSPWVILRLPSIRMIVVVCLILNNLKVRGIVSVVAETLLIVRLHFSWRGIYSYLNCLCTVVTENISHYPYQLQ